MINQRIFSANVGDISTGQAGPDAIEQDIDNLLANDQELLGTINEHTTQINSLDAYAVASGTNIYIATIEGYTLAEGKTVRIKFTNANTGASTLNINELGAINIIKGNGNALSSGNIKAGQICNLVYTGSVFQLLGEGGEYGTAIASNVLIGKTIGTEEGIIEGTMQNRGAVTNTITTQGASYTVPVGYHSGSGKVTASFSNLSAGNVRKGVNVGGVVGTVAEADLSGATSKIELLSFYRIETNTFTYLNASKITNATVFIMTVRQNHTVTLTSPTPFFTTYDNTFITSKSIAASSTERQSVVVNPYKSNITITSNVYGTNGTSSQDVFGTIIL